MPSSSFHQGCLKETVASVSGDSHRAGTFKRRQNVPQEQHFLEHLWERLYLCDILSWKDCIADVSRARGWCQHSPRGEVGEVGLDLWQWSGWHDKSLLGLTSSDYLRSRVDWFGHHLERKEVFMIPVFHSFRMHFY